MTALHGNGGLRYRHPADEKALFKTITVNELAPIIGAEFGGVDLVQSSDRQMDGIQRALALAPRFQCRFRWQANSVAFWDNRCVQHRAMWDYWPHNPVWPPRHRQGRQARLSEGDRT
jgi:hypothetical protein